MKKIILLLLVFSVSFSLVFAHIQMIYTPSSIIDAKEKEVNFAILFGHPASSGLTMDIGKNEAGELKGFKEFYSIHKGKKQDLLEFLKPIQFTSAENAGAGFSLILDKSSGFRGGGDWVLVGIPHPYFEPSDEAYMQQITKVFINKSGLTTDWNSKCIEGYPEIMPLVKPYEVGAGCVFRGIVLDSKGEPVANTAIEFEYVNYDVDLANFKFTGEPKLQKACSGMIFTDHTGVFEFIPPLPGFWGFCALGVGNEKEYNGKELTQDAVIWIEAFDYGLQDDSGAIEGEQSDDENAEGSVDQVTEKEKKKLQPGPGFSPAALIIVILLFTVMFAWPPIFKKISSKLDEEKK